MCSASASRAFAADQEMFTRLQISGPCVSPFMHGCQNGSHLLPQELSEAPDEVLHLHAVQHAQIIDVLWRAGLVSSRPTKKWRETLAILATYATGDFPALCDLLAHRLVSPPLPVSALGQGLSLSADMAGLDARPC